MTATDELFANNEASKRLNRKQSEDVIVAGLVSDEQAREIFAEWEAPRPYIRIVPQP